MNRSLSSISALFCTRTATPLVAALILFGVATLESSAITITYQVEDLPDLVVGDDLQKYSYAVSDFDFQQNQGFTIFFDAEAFRDLEATPPAPNADWDIITGEPIPLFGVPGIYDALSIVALSEIASLADPFTLSFVWIGAGSPGSQPFEVNEFDDQGNFIRTLASGQTVAAVSAVPESGDALCLFAFGLGSLALVRSRSREFFSL